MAASPDSPEQQIRILNRLDQIAEIAAFVEAFGSANSLPDYCKTENVWAMSRAIQKYGRYPLAPDMLKKA